MHPDLHRYLDGEISRDALAPELLAELEEWESLSDAAARLGSVSAPPWLEGRVMTALPAARPPLKRRVWDWFVQPQPIRLRPAAVAVAGAAFALALAVWPSGTAPVETPVAGPVAGVDADDAVVYVQFVFVNPDARSVAVAGDFNAWDAERHVLRDAQGDGVWTGLVAVPPGLHKYMFVVDGEEWVTDPWAGRYVDDGFGMRNAVLAVTPPQVNAS